VESATRSLSTVRSATISASVSLGIQCAVPAVPVNCGECPVPSIIPTSTQRVQRRESSAEPRSARANRSPAARFNLVPSSGATGLSFDEQNAAYVLALALSTVTAALGPEFQLAGRGPSPPAGSGPGRLPVMGLAACRADRATPTA
jgi:hypothetical protein